MSEPARSELVKREPVSVEYVPYGAQDKIKLSVNIVQNLVAVKTKSGQTCSDRDALKFLAMCQAKRMNPFEGDCFLIGYDGREGPSFALVTAHQTYLKRAELHPEFDGMKSGIIVRGPEGVLQDLEGDFFDEGQQVIGGWATVFFKTRKQPMHKRLRLARFQKPFGVWQEDPAGMICKCAEADALRSSFPTMLGGLYLREEIESPQVSFSKPDFGPSKPMFNGVKEIEAKPQATLPPSQQAEPASNEAPPAPALPQSPGFNALKAVRNLCKMSRVKEGKVLEQLARDNTTNGSHATLEELALSDGGKDILAAVADSWPDFVARMEPEKTTK